MAFRVGQKVVRFRFGWKAKLQSVTTPPIGETITISWIGSSIEGITIDFIEYPGPNNKHFDRGYYAQNFRPVVEKSTDIGMAILQEILDRETVKDDKPVKVRT